MKKTYPYITILMLTAAVGAANKPAAPFFTGNKFVLTSTSTPYNPLSYVATTEPDPASACMGSGNICIIDISSSDLYTALDAPSPSYIGKPKVDIATAATNELSDGIANALSTSGESTTPVNGRIFYEKF